MYAVVQTGGKQYRLSVGDSVRVEKLAGEPGDVIDLSDVLIVAGDGDRTTPVVVLDREQDVVSSTQLASGNPSTLTYDAHRDQLTLLAGGDVVGVDRSDLSRTSPLAESVGSAGRAGPGLGGRVSCRLVVDDY